MIETTTRMCGSCGVQPRRYANGRCRSCHTQTRREQYQADPAAGAARQREINERRRRDPERQERYLRKRLATNYGLTLEEYDALIVAADGKCAICEQSPYDAKRNGRPMIDHDHETGAVRGVLCRCCNSAIGMLGDDPELLEQAAAYLRRHQGG